MIIGAGQPAVIFAGGDATILLIPACFGVRETGERDRETGERDRETERQRDRETERGTERQERETERQERETERQRDREREHRKWASAPAFFGVLVSLRSHRFVKLPAPYDVYATYT